MNPRYILNYNSGIKIFDSDGKSTTFFSHVDDPKKLIFVDLLEKTCMGSCEHVLVRAYLPGGQILEGRVVGFVIDIYHKDSLFDGRFNVIPSKLD